MTTIGPGLLARLVRDHGAALVLYARQLCSWPEDVVQEAFLRLAREPEMPENPVGWLYRVVRNEAVSASRSAARRKRHEQAAAARQAWFEPANSDRLDAARVAECLAELPRDQRETIVARLWGGLSLAAVAELTGVSTSTAFRRYAAGLEALRARLGVREEGDEG